MRNTHTFAVLLQEKERRRKEMEAQLLNEASQQRAKWESWAKLQVRVFMCARLNVSVLVRVYVIACIVRGLVRELELKASSPPQLVPDFNGQGPVLKAQTPYCNHLTCRFTKNDWQAAHEEEEAEAALRQVCVYVHLRGCVREWVCVGVPECMCVYFACTCACLCM
jgi:hypothetical protein